MSLPVLIAVVIAGVSLVVALVHMTGGTASTSFFPGGVDHKDAIKQELASEFLLEFPDAVIRSQDFSPGGHHALFALAGNESAIAIRVGSKMVARCFERTPTCAFLDGDTIRVDLQDFTFPVRTIHYPDAALARDHYQTFFRPKVTLHE